ncbi:hypothetical protein B0H19DRAFT_1067978 [Mycena capillaripes]|nr:hypothetical protein B0H19DRAFT_1067978 [Mycena capillaripes]
MGLIPNELVGEIFEYLAEDYESLRACSLATSAFCSLGQPLLFRAIVVRPPNVPCKYTDCGPADFPSTLVPSGSARAASTLLAGSPHLTVYIRDVVIELEYRQDEVSVENVLRSLSKLERLVFAGNILAWKHLSRGFTSAILATFEQPTLDRVHLFNFRNIPIALILRLMSSVRVPSLFQVQFQPDSDVDVLVSPRASPLEYLSIGTVRARRHIDLLAGGPPVRHLHLNTSVFSAQQILATPSVARTLEYLDLTLRSCLETPLILDSLLALRSFQLRLSLRESRRIPPGLSPILAGVPRIPVTLVIGITDRLDKPRIENWQSYPPQVDAAMRDSVFDGFRAAFGAALRGLAGFMPNPIDHANGWPSNNGICELVDE